MEWLKKLATRIVALAKVSKKAFLVFWNIDDGDSKKEIAVKVAQTASKGAAYSAIDWALTLLSPTIVGFCKWMKLTDGITTLVLWAFDLICAHYLVKWNDAFVEDLTLTDALRRAIDEMKKESKLIAYTLILLILIRFTFWDGPERVALFFKKELPSKREEMLILILFSLFQAILWTKLYSLGIDSGWALIKWVINLF